MANDPAGTGRLLLFGASGAIGSAIASHYRMEGWQVTGITRDAHRPSEKGYVTWDPLGDNPDCADAVIGEGPFDAVCWAQGSNCTDSIFDFDIATHELIYRANVLFVLASLSRLLQANVLSRPSRLCVISSIWQNHARQNKLSYSVSKAAIQGVVLSLANDLGREGILVNAILPGVIDTPMTRENLTPEQIKNVMGSTQFGRLTSLADVAVAVYGLASFRNTGTTGQFVNVDLGYAHARII